MVSCDYRTNFNVSLPSKTFYSSNKKERFVHALFITNSVLCCFARAISAGAMSRVTWTWRIASPPLRVGDGLVVLNALLQFHRRAPPGRPGLHQLPAHDPNLPLLASRHSESQTTGRRISVALRAPSMQHWLDVKSFHQKHTLRWTSKVLQVPIRFQKQVTANVRTV